MMFSVSSSIKDTWVLLNKKGNTNIIKNQLKAELTKFVFNLGNYEVFHKHFLFTRKPLKT